MKAYKQLVAHVLENGTRYETNKGACIGVIGAQVTYDIHRDYRLLLVRKLISFGQLQNTQCF